jgi:hypothetical protein
MLGDNLEPLPSHWGMGNPLYDKRKPRFGEDYFKMQDKHRLTRNPALERWYKRYLKGEVGTEVKVQLEWYS